MERVAVFVQLLCFIVGIHGATYEVGPGKALANPGEGNPTLSLLH
jgi:hypothetical protein